ncbi:sigma-70 family RNA polymerase sigma factor [Bordetella bronchiseptica]|uniref:sigma-70 family RNA polymerase sigma factor n=1 Tax=Bordetella bronchiseptica TaxID=518 RepID=UPI000528DF50|nr:sigma-70 family RNA polymerase sigma factor [Bordetella bronchiseptica]AZW32005.1 RNA polymerase subunit sigma [Bordetella bronchiseptica]
MPASLITSPSARPAADTAAVEGLYRQHRSWLAGWLRRRLGCPHRAEDLTQDVFVRVIQGRKAVRMEQARALLATIAKGLVIDHQRRAALEHAYLEYLAAQPPGHAPSPQQQAELLQALAELDRLFEGLPPRARAVFLMSQLEGLGYAEIAQRLRISLSSVQQYMLRAMSACYMAFHE